MDPRQRVTDLQRLILFLAGVGAVFLAAMACGGSDVWLLIYAAGLIIVVGGVVAASVIRRSMTRHEIVTARVLSASAPRANAGIMGRCDLRLEVFVPGRGRVEARHRAESVPLIRWPQPNQWLPVQISGGSARRLRVRWDLLEAGVIRKPEAAPAGGPTGSDEPVWEDEEATVVYSPTPPRPRRPAAPPEPEPQPAPAPTAPPLYEDFIDEPPVRTPPPASVRNPPSVPYPETVTSNGNDPDGYDPADFEAVTLPDFDPADIDRRDFGEDEPEPSTINPPPDVPPPAEPPAADPLTIPQPRDGTEPPAREESPLPTAWILPPAGAARGGTGLGATLPVADLARSLRFYHDLLGFTITFTSPDSAVVESEGTRILLDQVGDPAGREPLAD